MLESLLNKDIIIRKEILKIVALETNVYNVNFNFILENLLKVKKIDTFISGVILMNPKNYFGKYSLDYNKDLKILATKHKNEKFLKNFVNTYTRKIFKNQILDKSKLEEIKRYYNVEKEVYFYLYQKKYYDITYNISLEKIQTLKKEIYEAKKLNIDNKFFHQEIIFKVKKGKEYMELNVFNTLIDIVKSNNINSKLKDHILELYNTEYLLVKDYL